ncbi:DUF58 domain-containing protein [Pseudoalteromonas sp. SSDWG2]|uniref:DUF58 domain-containing protein n=1 Tax=Pseudoalteromonas sp. SSDWG2 TaxID=3139391 RepID=UPI003BA8D827
MFAFVHKAMAPLTSYIEALLLRNKHKKKRITLDHSTLYVLPSKLGMFFLLIAVLNFLLATNYQNNLIHVCAYLMLVLVLMSLIQAYVNMKGLTIEFVDIPDCFSNQPSAMKLRVKNEYRTSHAIKINWQGTCVLVDYADDVMSDVVITCHNDKRGKYNAQRMKISSTFPFGLAQVWSYLDTNAPYFVYPSPLNHSQSLAVHDSDEDNAAQSKHVQSGNDEFDGLKEQKHFVDYRRISWKHYAKREQTLVKEFVTESNQSRILDFAQFQTNTEQALCMMAYSVEMAKNSQTPLAMRLPTASFGQENSATHYQKLLRALATFNQGAS